MPQEFGNWLVTEEGIEWTGTRPKLIVKTDLVDKRGTNLYNWPLHIVTTTVTKEDLRDFNTAFVFALQYFDLGFSPNFSLTETFLEQSRLFNENNEPQDDEISIGGQSNVSNV